jgi:hypothetical protein
LPADDRQMITTSINRIFLCFMAAAGAASGLLLVAKPELRDFRIAPYFWVLIAMALFEAAAYLRGQGAPGTMVTMDVRLFGFLLGILLMVLIPIVAGSPGRLF